MKVKGQIFVVVAAIVVAALLAAGCAGESDQRDSGAPSADPVRFAQPPLGPLKGLPIAPDSQRVDLAAPRFSNPTNVTNPLFPISKLQSALMLGRVGGKRFRVEVTLLPGTTSVDWNGRRVQTLQSQYVAFLDGRLHEVALDLYAQDDGGSVWYLGENVFNYEDGAVADTDGTWHAGEEGPAGMIMPADPQVGDVYRPENIPSLVFEEVTVKKVGETVNGPGGPVHGAIVVRELHQEGTFESKTFAPGYGEFYTGAGGDVEAVALAVPTDGLPGPPPAQLETLSEGANHVFAAVRAKDWSEVSATVETMATAWKAYRARGVPDMLDAQMKDALDSLVAAVDAHQRRTAGQASLDVARASLDLRLRYQPVAEIDRARFDVSVRQLLLDAAAGDAAGVTGDVATLEWTWDRIARTFRGEAAKRIEARLRYLRAAADAKELAATSNAAARLRQVLSSSSHRKPV